MSQYNLWILFLFWESPGATAPVAPLQVWTCLSDYIKSIPNFQAVALLRCIWEGSGSNLGQDTDYSGWGFPYHLQSLLENPGIEHKLGHDHFLRHPFRSTVHSSYSLLYTDLSYWRLRSSQVQIKTWKRANFVVGLCLHRNGILANCWETDIKRRPHLSLRFCANNKFPSSVIN
jgi:hypothetical protein